MNNPITARYPSNIALVKYWGKHGNQLPCNASLSMTLSQAYTEVNLFLQDKKSEEPEFTFLFNGKPKESFRQRILKYILKQKEFSGLLEDYALHIESQNSFPHSAGVASSASAFAAIAAALLKASQGDETDFPEQQASRLARLGSGSACRSFYGPFALWGKLKDIPDSNDEFAIRLGDIHENFQNMRDSILIVEDKSKSVSSSLGHSLMEGHPFAESRFKQANNHCMDMLKVLKDGDFQSFIYITEREALSLHAMMMTSREYFMLMQPETVKIIDEVKRFRVDTGLPLCYTLDAGPNIHLLYPKTIEDEITPFVNNFLHNHTIKSMINDYSGRGGIIS